MIPVKLTIKGFLSYRDPVALDFRAIDLACISGHNGAGKSSLLDAITWVIFGQARTTGEAIINLATDTAEVTLEFQHEGNEYRILRSLKRGKNTLLEFQIKAGSAWKVLTEKSVRETQEKIEATIHLDYETFVSSSFFLQGRADSFTQQKPSDRKRILSNILGLEAWESYREATAIRRRTSEEALAGIDGAATEIEQELGNEQRYTQLKAEAETGLKSAELAVQTSRDANTLLRQMAAKANETAARAKELTAKRAALDEKIQKQQAVIDANGQLLGKESAIRTAYQNLAKAREDLAQMQAKVAPATNLIASQKALETEIANLKVQVSENGVIQGTIKSDQTGLDEIKASIAGLVPAVEALEKYRADLEANEIRQAELKSENAALHKSMEEARRLLDELEKQTSTCPVCGQALSEEKRAERDQILRSDGLAKKEQFKANEALIQELVKAAAVLRDVINKTEIKRERLDSARKTQTRLEERITANKSRLNAEAEKTLQDRVQQLALLQTELKNLQYDQQAFQALLAKGKTLEGAEGDLRALDAAIAANTAAQEALDCLMEQYAEVDDELARIEAEAPADLQARLEASETALLNAEESHKAALSQVAAYTQRLEQMTASRARLAELQQERGARTDQVNQFKTLEKAFGKNGVPALLIEQALPEIENKANVILELLSGGSTQLRFVTQSAYKDAKRSDLKETLDIVISDPVGEREYEMFSGGEAFRINFALRVALAEVLATRAGTRVETLVIDEGFGSQDALGRQRLIEAICAVKSRFAKILVVSHIDEIKDAFPNRIELSKENGTTVVSVQ
jgi:ATPase involved in DNA repair